MEKYLDFSVQKSRMEMDMVRIRKETIMRRAKLTALVLSLAMAMSTAGAFACTGVYIGSEASLDGTTIVGRSEDQGKGFYSKMFKVEPRKTEAGRYYVDEGVEQEGFKVPLPETTYKYTYVPDSSDLEDGQYPGSCTNEYGVVVVGTVSASPKAAFEEQDPYVHPGLREAILPGLIACQVKTARGAVDKLAELTDKYGSEEGNILFFVDKKEAWIFESYGGHQYAAMKMPKDKVSVFGNHFMIGQVNKNDHRNFVFSDGLFETMEKAGGVVIENGKYNLVKSISDYPREDYNNMRNWGGMKLLAPSKAGAYSDNTYYPLFYKPDHKVSVGRVMDVFRYRYEGTEFDMMKPGNEGMRAIGVARSSQVHIVQNFKFLPSDTCNLQWLAMGNAEHSVFIPAFSGITDTHPAYQVDGSYKYNHDSLYSATKRMNVASYDRQFLSQGVKDYWKLQEKMMIRDTKKELAKIGRAYAKGRDNGRTYVTELSKEYAEEQYKNSDALFDELLFTSINNVNDRPDNGRKAVFVPNIDLVKCAKAAGYYVNSEDGETYTFTKYNKTAKYVVKAGEKNCTARIKGTTKNVELSRAPYVENGVLYAPTDFARTL